MTDKLMELSEELVLASMAFYPAERRKEELEIRRKCRFDPRYAEYYHINGRYKKFFSRYSEAYRKDHPLYFGPNLSDDIYFMLRQHIATMRLAMRTLVAMALLTEEELTYLFYILLAKETEKFPHTLFPSRDTFITIDFKATPKPTGEN